MVVLARTRKLLEPIGRALVRQRIAIQTMAGADFRRFDWHKPTVKLLTLHSAKGLEFPQVFITGLDAMPLRGEPLDEEARLLYVGMTRATQRLVLSAAGPSVMVERVRNALDGVRAQFEATQNS
jgi:superfamily I DNA/RNA helicase